MALASTEHLQNGAVFDADGRQVVVQSNSTLSSAVSGVTAAITGTTDTSVIAAQGSGVRTYITSIVITNSHATTDTLVEIKDGTTVVFRAFAKAAGGGVAIAFPTPLRGTANTAWNAANVTNSSNTYVSLAGFTSTQ